MFQNLPGMEYPQTRLVADINWMVGHPQLIPGLQTVASPES